MMTISPVSGRLVGYARVSTIGQDLAYQLQRLEGADCDAIFREKRTAKDTLDRPQLRKLLKSLKPSDIMLATAIDRVSRDPVDLFNIIKTIKDAGAGLRLLDEPFIDTTSELADLIVFLVGWAARWHRRRLLENTAQGRELARQRGVRFGRKPKLSSSQQQEVWHQRQAGVSVADIAQSFGVSQSTVSRVYGANVGSAGATLLRNQITV
jgi:DNA invertase Pin-like site-specific DNA recombinase